MKKARVGVLGAGRGMTFVGVYSKLPGAEVVALCDKDQRRLEAAASQTNLPDLKLFTDYEEMLKEDLDIIVVASDGTLHAEHSIMALKAGKHVLSEVPMDYSFEKIVKLVETVKETGLKYMMAENCDYFPFMPTIQAYIEEGKLGEVVYVEAEYVHDVRSIYYRDETGKYYSLEQAKALNFQARYSTPAGGERIVPIVRTWRSGIHPIQYITHSLGPVLKLLQDRCVSVSCLSTGAWTSPEDGNPDAEVAIFKTAKGKVIKVLCAHTIAHPGHLWWTFMGTKGSLETPRGSAKKPVIYFEGEGEQKRWKEVEPEDFNAPLPEEAKQTGHSGSDWFPSNYFLRSVLYDEPIPIDVYRAADYTVPGICAVWSAEKGGTAVEIPDLRTVMIDG